MTLPEVYDYLKTGGTLRLQLTDQCVHIELCARLQSLAMTDGLFLLVTEHPRVNVVYVRLMYAGSYERMIA